MNFIKMPDPDSAERTFLARISKVIEENIAEEQFGVSELARALGMSRSNLLRKVKRASEVSVSQFIRQVRLQHAVKILREGSLTVSEVSYKVGFSSTSYFIKCFREHFGYPPGEMGKHTPVEENTAIPDAGTPIHRLAAIMFTDIEGYTALMQRDEQQAIELRNHHREVFNSITHRFNGKILQYYGDGTLSTFASAIDAVRCGIELQLEFTREPKIPVRIGVHTGDIIITEEDIIGDGVNIASRIESLAAAGSVFVSEKVYDEVKNQSGIQTALMGLFELKNVGKPVEVYAISNQGLVVPDADSLQVKRDSRDAGSQKEAAWGKDSNTAKWIMVSLAVIVMAFVAYWTLIREDPASSTELTASYPGEKSIAVLPFINDSDDSSNVYFINGLMESTLNNLQKIKDLKVISRTSVEKYRVHLKTAPEIARELNVHYLIEGSGQKIGDEIMLNIQLIEAQTDRHLWSRQYQRQTSDIFNLQAEVAKNIADEISVILTPEEKARIDKPPTGNLLAYDYFLKGYDLLYPRTPENLVQAIQYFKEAIAQDAEFARAYATIAMCYYYLDEGQAIKKYSEEINHYADQALLYDDQLPQSLIAKGLYYMHSHDYNLAVSYFEKTLEYNPNASLVYAFLVELYVNYLPNTEKYLEYALKGLKLDVTTYDSVTLSFMYLHMSNAFMQSGFIDEAEQYINTSLAYYPGNLYSEYTRAYVLYAINEDLPTTKVLLLQALKKDTMRFDIIQEVGKICYYLRDYECAYFYYNKFLAMKNALNLNIYQGENAKIAFVLAKMGLDEESDKYFEIYKEYADNDPSIYKHLSLAVYYSYRGDRKRAIEHLRIFSQEDHYPYLLIPFLKIDPLVDNIKDLPEFEKIMTDIELGFWDYHEKMQASLRNEGLI